MRRRSGRRPGHQDTRQAIINSARDAFGEDGYDGASIRRIAIDAAVDPALVHHYFGTKERLFLEIVKPPVNPGELLPPLFVDGVDRLGERLVDTFLSVWENPVSRPAFEAMLRGAFGSQLPARLIREFFATHVVRRAIQELGTVIDVDQVPLRTTLIASQLFGLATIRYILKVEPLASATREEVIATVAPTLHRYLTDDLGC
jgi:AcrR family transcriptional regulator